MSDSTQNTYRHRVLLISYLFPPCGESGVQRNLKYAKYLLQFGWKPYILTVKDIFYHSYDYSLLNQLSKEVVIARTGSLDPYRIASILIRLFKFKNGNSQKQSQNDQKGKTWSMRIYRTLRDWLVFPDTCVAWIPFAFLRGFFIIKKHKIEAIVASVWPYSSAVVSYLLSKATGIPFMLDFRDGWTDDPYLGRPTVLHKNAHRFLEKLIVPRANAASVYGDFLRDLLAVKYPELRLEVLTNGFDPEDFVGIKPALKKEGLRRIVYSGSVYSNYTFFRSMLDSLYDMPRSFLDKFEIVFVGRVEIPNAQDLISERGLEHNVKLIGYVAHTTAIEYLLSADALLFGLPAADIWAYSGKIFEYIMTKKPIISFVNNQGIAADLLRQIGCGDWILPPGQEKRFAEKITSISNLGWPELQNNDIEKFSRKDLTRRLAEILKSLTD